MLAKDLVAITKIASKISNPSSLTSLYRAIEIGPETVRCCSEFGNLEMQIQNSGLEKPALLDCEALNGVASTLPKASDIVLVAEGNKIRWSCGSAKGVINEIATDHSIPKLDHADFPWTPPPDLGLALVLASSACQSAAVAFGLYGITMEVEDDKLHLLSSNTWALASSIVEKGSFPTTKVTLRPPVPGLIADLIGSCPNCALDVTGDGIFLKGDWLTAHLPLGSNLERDLKLVAAKFTETKHTAKIDSSAVRKFIARAKVLTDGKNAAFTVKMKVEEGRLILEHAGISSSTEEWFLADGLNPALAFAPVALPADMLLLPLQYVSTAVFDYLDQKRLVLRAETPNFTYVLSGETE
jgi:hypothetical protein